MFSVEEYVMWLSTVGKYIQLTYHVKKMVLESAFMFRASFIVQVIGMFFNDAAWLSLWYIFFKAIPAINGWGFDQMVLLFAFACVVIGALEVFFDGLSEISHYVVTGQLDIYLTMPKNLLWLVAVGKTDIAALGDLFFGLVLMIYAFWFAPLKILWFCLVCGLSLILFLDFMLIIQSLAFWFGDIEYMAKQLIHMLIGFMIRPQSTFTGGLKVLMMTIIPAFFMVTVPLDLLIQFSWSYCGILLVSVIVGTTIALTIFSRGLSKYESGNLMLPRQ